MRRIVSIGLALLVVTLAGMTAIGAVAAQGPANTEAPAGTGVGRMWGHMRTGAGVVSEVITGLLGLTQDEIHAARQDGQTLAEIAAAQGVTSEDLVEAIVTARVEAVNQAVADGRLTQDQADRMLERAQEQAELKVTSEPGEGRMGFGGGRMGRGLSGGMRGGQRGGFGGTCPNATLRGETSS